MAFLSIEQLEDLGFASLGEDVFISDKASIYNPSNISIGSYVRIDDFAIISAGQEGIEIGNYVHIAPGAVLSGAVSIGEGTFVGANAVVKQGIRVGKNVIIGAGAVVTKDIADGLTVYGNPARKK